MSPPVQPRPPRSAHVLVWLVWVACMLLVLQTATSPPAVALIIGVAALVVATCGGRDGLARAFPALVAFATAFAVIRVLLTILTTHGGDDVLVRLPSAQLPALLGGFTLGGTVHRAILLRSVTEGLVVVGIITSLAAFNAVVSHHELLRILPRAFHELALVVTLALTFVPTTLAAISAVREADRARTGLHLAGRRGWARRLAAVLETAMEKAVLLSESMESRGFGHTGPGNAERRASRFTLTGLLLCAAAFGAMVAGRQVPAVIAALAGAGLLAAAVTLVSRARPRTGLPRRRMTRRDGVVIGVLVAAAAGVVVLAAAGAEVTWDLRAQPLPPLPPLAVPLIILLAAPAADAMRGAART